MNRTNFQIQPDETVITGRWEEAGGKVKADASFRRIQWLISTNKLKEVSVGEWEALYQDTDDQRFWVLSYPQGHLHGGGPPELRVIGVKDAAKRFRLANVI